MTATSSRETERITALDGVRGLAILMVLAHQLILDAPSSTHVWQSLRSAMDAGWIGVQLFFVLSGFLITRILTSTRRSENYWQSFYMRRALRIFPLYYLLLAVMFWGVSRFESLPRGLVVAPADRVWFWTYLSNWGALFGADTGALGHCWSLAVEEQFYLLWPLFVRWLDDRSLARLCGGLALLALVLRIAALACGATPGDVYANTLTRVDALALGSLAAVVESGETAVGWYQLARRHWRVLTLLLLVVGVLSGGFGRTDEITLTVGHTVLAVVFALALGAIADWDRRGVDAWWCSLLRSPLLRAFGKHSYAIYLIHLPIHVWLVWMWLEHLVGQASPEGAVAVQLGYWLVGPLLLLAIARVIYVVVEGPILGLKHHFSVRV